MTLHRTGPWTEGDIRRMKYSNVVRRLEARYTDRATGRLVTHIGGEPTRYWILESMAAVKYLHCDPAKLGVEGLEKARINLA